jgi:hypothetical protein
MQIFDNLLGGPNVMEQAETALCMWEAVLEDKRSGQGTLFEWFAQGEGTCMARQRVIEFAHIVESIYRSQWRHHHNPFSEYCFDWKVVPAILKVCACIATDPTLQDALVDDIPVLALEHLANLEIEK